MTELKEEKLKSLCTLVTDGTHDTPKVLNEGVPFIKAKQIANNFVDFDDCEFISYEDHLKVISRSKPEYGDTLFAHIGASLGASAYINKNIEFSIKNIALFKPNREKVHPRYLYYLTLDDEFQNRIKNFRTGSAQPFVSLNILRNHKVSYNPDLLEQEKIISILSPLDDLIETNNHRIRLLMGIVKLIYEEWFVNYHFPGHEDIKMVDSGTEFAEIPEGWDVKGMFKNHHFKFIKDKVKPYNGMKRYYATADIDGYNIVGQGIDYDYENKPSRAQKQPVLFSMWFARMQETYKIIPITKVNENWADNSIISSGFAGFLAKEEFVFPYLFSLISSERFHSEKDRYCTGATQRSLANKGLKAIKTLVPPKDLIKKYGDLVFPIIDMMLYFLKKNDVLKTTRDSLLSKLISGEIDVSDLDIEIA